MSYDWAGDILVKFPGILLGIGLHEWAHAFVADRSGDPTPRQQGRLTLDLVRHLDPLGTLCIFFGPVGWGRPVQVVPQNFRDPVGDHVRVALAGPLMNLVVGAGALLAMGCLRWGRFPWLRAGAGHTGWEILAWIALINVFLALFNMIPIPPLDGSRVFWGYLGDSGNEFLHWVQPVSVVILWRACAMGAFAPLYRVSLEAVGSLLDLGLGVQVLLLAAAALTWAANADLLASRAPPPAHE